MTLNMILLTLVVVGAVVVGSLAGVVVGWFIAQVILMINKVCSWVGDNL